MIERFSLIVTTIIFWHLCSFVTLAESKKIQGMDRFPPSPLEMTTDDPLVRSSVQERPLTVEEKSNLEFALDNLNQEAIKTLQRGEQQTAFEIWNRELRLRRFLGLFAEVQALSRVGAIAWNERETQQVRYITKRLREIDNQMRNEKRNNLPLWRSLGAAYQNVRFPQLAVGAYQQVLNLEREEKDINTELATLNLIGELQLSYFDYSQAAKTYERMLSFTNQRGDKSQQLTYLKELAYIYQRLQDNQQAINVLNKLAAIYTRDNNLIAVPPLKIAIAENYQSIANQNTTFLQEAFNNYQEAYVTAWNLQSYVLASEALQKLIQLYRSQNQIDEALQTSKILLETQTLTTNFYGLMQTHDQMGELYLEKQDSRNALASFQKGLEIAQQLKYQEDYFTDKIKIVTSYQ
jgi:tetratricopeptide (TPR) repeat protein